MESHPANFRDQSLGPRACKANGGSSHAKRCSHCAAPADYQEVAPDRPWVWLNAAWQDLMADPRIGFLYGGALAPAGWLLIMILPGVRSAWVILPASAGFFMVAPLARDWAL